MGFLFSKIFLIIGVFFGSHLFAYGLRVDSSQLLQALEAVERRSVASAAGPLTYRWNFLIRIGPRPLGEMAETKFIAELLTEISLITDQTIKIDEEFLDLLFELRPHLLADLKPNWFYSRRFYQNLSRKKLWEKINFRKIFAEYLLDSRNQVPANLISYLDPSTFADAGNKARPTFVWWVEVVEAYHKALDDGQTYGELFDAVKSILEKHQVVDLSRLKYPDYESGESADYLRELTHLLRTKVAQALRLHSVNLETSKLLAALVSSVLPLENSRLKVCTFGTICWNQSGGPQGLRASNNQLHDAGILTKAVGCHQGCRASRHLGGGAWPKTEGPGSSFDSAPGAGDVLGSPGLFVPAGALCQTTLAKLRAIKLLR